MIPLKQAGGSKQTKNAPCWKLHGTLADAARHKWPPCCLGTAVFTSLPFLSPSLPATMLPRSVALAACACLLLAASGRLPAAADARRGLLVDGGGPGCDTCRRVTGDGVRVRTDPCTDATVLGLLFKGDKVRGGTVHRAFLPSVCLPRPSARMGRPCFPTSTPCSRAPKAAALPPHAPLAAGQAHLHHLLQQLRPRLGGGRAQGAHRLRGRRVSEGLLNLLLAHQASPRLC